MKIILSVAAILLLSACTPIPSGQHESIPGKDYQRCLDAEQMGGGEEIASRCGKLQQEIDHTPN